jgi:hypothetical protein
VERHPTAQNHFERYFDPETRFLTQKSPENTLQHILYTILWLDSFSNVKTTLETIFYEIRGLQSVLNMVLMLEPVL